MLRIHKEDDNKDKTILWKKDKKKKRLDMSLYKNEKLKLFYYLVYFFYYL